MIEIRFPESVTLWIRATHIYRGRGIKSKSENMQKGFATSLIVPVIVGIVLYCVNYSLLKVMFMQFPQTIDMVMGKGSWWVSQPVHIQLIYVVGLSPVIEEVVFRRGIFNWFIEKEKAMIGLPISSALFGLYHILFGWGWLKAIDMFFVGLVFGLVYIKYRLRGSWICHTSNNIGSMATLILVG